MKLFHKIIVFLLRTPIFYQQEEELAAVNIFMAIKWQEATAAGLLFF